MEEEIPTINAESFDNYKYTPLGRMLIGKNKRDLNQKDSLKLEIIENEKLPRL